MADAAEEAFGTYLETRRHMRELANARGIYPIVAIGPTFDEDGKGRGKGGSQTSGQG